MIFKEQDVMNITKNKKAIQSSISQWSNINDANRVLRSDLEVDDFAMHTGYEANPWWMLDLENETAIDCVRITNRSNKAYQESLKDVKIELSADKQTWFLVDPSCFEWKNGLDILDVNIYQAMSARYIKISLQAHGHLVLKKVEVFVRKIKGLAIASLSNYSAYGDRLITFLNAMYVAKHTGLKFAFGWKPLTLEHMMDSQKSKEIKPIILGSEEEVFDKDFIKKYSYTKNEELKFDVFGPDFSHVKTNIEEYSNCQNSIYHYGYYFTHCFHLFVKNLPKNYTKEFKDLFGQIGFSKQIEQSINIAKDIFHNNFKQKDAIAIHIRSGDLVYGNCRSINLYLAHNDKGTPIEIALELIIKNLNKTIILFGEDKKTTTVLIDFFQANYQKKIYHSNDFIPSNLNAMQIDFFEMIFMSCCKEIISPSGFARLASLIGNGEESKRWTDIFSLEEQFQIFRKNLNLIQIDNFQSAYSYFCYFMIAEKLGKDNELLYDILKKAQKYDVENVLYRILIVDCLLRKNDYRQAENYFKSIMDEEYFSVYNLAFRSYVENIAFKYFDETKLSNFPHLSYMMAKIYFLDKDYQNCAKYIGYALNQEKDNEVFLDFKNKIQANQESLDKQQNDKNLQSIGAAERFKNHLAYKLGQAVIENSKSFMGYIRMPYVLSYIKDKHKEEQKAYQALIAKNPKLKLPKLEEYTDYNEALKVKEHLSYKLGEALMRADKIWYLGGYIKFYFEAKRLYKEFKKAKNEI